jgi:hypothetical protein
MANPETTFGEHVGADVRNAGIVIGLLGLIASPELFFLGAGLAVSGEIYKRSSKDSKGDSQAA